MYRIEVNHNDKENERIHKQCERMVKLVDDEQIALIVLGEYSKQEGGIRCKATTVVHANEYGKLALAAALSENMMTHDDVHDIIFAAVSIFEQHQQYKASQN